MAPTSRNNHRGGHLNPCPICRDHNSYTYPQFRSHFSQRHICTRCARIVRNRSTHVCTSQRGGGTAIGDGISQQHSNFVEVQTSLLGVFRRYQLVNTAKTILIGQYYKVIYHQLKDFLSTVIREYKGIKIRFVLDITMIKYQPDEDGNRWREEQNYLNSNTYLLLNDYDIKPNLYDIASDHIQHLNTMSQKGSGWSISKINTLNIYTSFPRFVRTGAWIPTPTCFQRRKGLINIKAPGNRCFMYAAACKFLGHKSQRKGGSLAQYKIFEKINGDKKYINFSPCKPNSGIGVTVGEINQFERKNEKWAVNLYKCNPNTGNIFPSRVTQRPSAPIKLDLLEITDGEKKHVVLISSLSSFLGKAHSLKKYYCRGCLSFYRSKIERDDHSVHCGKYFSQVIKFPKQQYKDYSCIRWYDPYPMFVIADFETERDSGEEVDSSTMIEHVDLLRPYSYQYIVFSGNRVEKYKSYLGRDSHAKFVAEMLELSDLYLKRVSAYTEVPKLTADELHDFEVSKACCICHKHFELDLTRDHAEYWEKRKVRHHSHGINLNVFHDSPKYSGAAHNSCNRNLVYRKKFPVLFHNLKSFDSKLILQGAGELGIQKPTVLARSCEKFLSITLNSKVTFIDSLAHLPMSLDSLVKDLKKDGVDKFAATRQIFQDSIPDDQFELLLGKLAFPYDYVTRENVNQKINCLPEKHLFFNSLKNCEVEDSAHQNAQKVFKLFDCESLKDYMKIYGLLDVSLLCDVWVNYRKICLELFQVDPTSYVSLPSMSYRVALNWGKAKLEYIRNMDLLLLAQRSKIGGIVDVIKRFAKSNIPHLPGYNPQLPIRYIIQLDVNGLYSHVMRKFPLPTKGFRKLTKTEVDNFSVMTHDELGSHGFLIECDIDYTGYKHVQGKDVHVHDYLKFLPPFPERTEIKSDMINPEYRKFYEQNEHLPNNLGKTIISCNLLPKQKYVVFLPMLKQGIRLGATVSKIHQIYTFEQEAFMHPFVNLNCEKRKVAKSSGESACRKLSCNSCYGYFGMDVTKFLNIVPVTHMDAARKLISKPTFKSFRIINDNLALVEMQREKVEMNNHNLVAGAILDWSKAYFYKMLYAFLDHFWGSIELDYVDTDSACLEIILKPGQNVWEELKKVELDGQSLMDMSFLDAQDPQFNNNFKGETGKVQDDNWKGLGSEGGFIHKAYFVRKKAYGLMFHKGRTKMKLKGGAVMFLTSRRY